MPQQLQVRQVTTSLFAGPQAQLKQLSSPPNERGGPGIGRFPPTTAVGSVRVRIVLRDSVIFLVVFFMLARPSNLDTHGTATETSGFAAREPSS